MAYKLTIYFSDGTSEEVDEVFETDKLTADNALGGSILLERHCQTVHRCVFKDDQIDQCRQHHQIPGPALFQSFDGVAPCTRFHGVSVLRALVCFVTLNNLPDRFNALKC